MVAQDQPAEGGGGGVVGWWDGGLVVVCWGGGGVNWAGSGRSEWRCSRSADQRLADQLS